MKKTSRKLVLCRETVRTLAKLDLTLAIGGANSGGCAIAFDTGDQACEAPHLAVLMTKLGV
jgi:hypothetical protein